MHGIKKTKNQHPRNIATLSLFVDGNFEDKFKIILVNSAPRHIFSYTQFLS